MAGQHTPGPWKSTGRQGDRWDTKWLIHHRTPTVDGGYFVEVVPLHLTAEAMATAEANVRLITAAPDLLAACEAWQHANRTKQREDVDKATWLTEAAIAKARGEEATP